MKYLFVFLLSLMCVVGQAETTSSMLVAETKPNGDLELISFTETSKLDQMDQFYLDCRQLNSVYTCITSLDELIEDGETSHDTLWRTGYKTFLNKNDDLLSFSMFSNKTIVLEQRSNKPRLIEISTNDHHDHEAYRYIASNFDLDIKSIVLILLKHQDDLGYSLEFKPEDISKPLKISSICVSLCGEFIEITIGDLVLKIHI